MKHALLLTSADHNDWTYDSNNRLISYNGFSYTYDANGNMTSKTDQVLSQVTSYQYGYENKLKRIDYPDGTYSEYRYDPFGKRIKKDVNGTVTWFVYDLIKMLPDVIAEYDGGGTLIAGYTHGPGIDDVISMRRGGDSYYYFKDALGSITSLSDSSETTVNNYEYDAFGSVFSKTELVVNPYGFTGRVLDNESGLMYYRMRYYDQGIGRFITADPIRFQGGINFYTYVKNNPVNYVDPEGKIEPLTIIIIITAIGAVSLTYKFYQCCRWAAKAMDKAREIRRQLERKSECGIVSEDEVFREMQKTEDWKKVMHYCPGAAIQSYTSP